MKNCISFSILVAVLAVVISCKDNKIVPAKPTGTTDGNMPKNDSIKTIVLKPTPTKEPYILLEDDGFEAELIAQGIDTDDQINGKIAIEDVEKTENFGWPGVIHVNDGTDYFDTIRNRYFDTMPVLEKQYEEKTGIELIAKKLSDINKFKKLKYFYINFPINPIDSLDFSANTQLEIFEIMDAQIRVINFNDCKQMKKIDFLYSVHPLKITILDKIYISQCSTLEYLSYNGDPRTLDISLNTNLKYLEIVNRGDLYQLRDEKLDLCNNPRLESLFVHVDYYKNIYLSKDVYLTYENSRNQNASNGFALLHISRAEISVCK